MGIPNKYLVGIQGKGVVIMRAPGYLTKESALELAAYLVAAAETSKGEFDKILKDVRES